MKTFLMMALALWMTPALAAQPPAKTQVQWHGHAAFSITTPQGKVLWIDPWLKNPVNPAASGGKDPLASVSRADVILLTHGHFDHVGESVELAKKTKARLVANFELGTQLAHYLGYPQDQMGFDGLMNMGGEIEILDGEVKVRMVPAVHSSGLDVSGQKADQKIVYGGNPVGFVISVRGGPSIYHSGDTAYFQDMSGIGPVDLALINIGGHFGMEPGMAAKAAKAVQAKWVVPHHFKTFPVLTQDAGPFLKAVSQQGQKGLELKPGETLTFQGRSLTR